MNMREKIARAIMRAFNRTEEKHGITFDPDTCYEAATEVQALLLNTIKDDEDELTRFSCDPVKHHIGDDFLIFEEHVNGEWRVIAKLR